MFMLSSRKISLASTHLKFNAQSSPISIIQFAAASRATVWRHWFCCAGRHRNVANESVGEFKHPVQADVCVNKMYCISAAVFYSEWVKHYGFAWLRLTVDICVKKSLRNSVQSTQKLFCFYCSKIGLCMRNVLKDSCGFYKYLPQM